jgi:hypothetical protein
VFWNDFKVLQLIRAMQSPDKLKSGIACYFLKLDKLTGVKLYRLQKQRDYAFILQKKAAKHGLAPKVGQKFIFPCFKVKNYDFEVSQEFLYGYLTEVAFLRSIVSYPRLKTIKKALRKVGISHGDLNEDNVGFLRKSMVCIDFDECSCSKVRKRKKKRK